MMLTRPKHYDQGQAEVKCNEDPS